LKDLPIILLRNSDNKGFSKANNQAIRRSTAPFLLLLNPDAEVTEGAIDKLMLACQQHDRIGVCGPRLFFMDGRIQPSVFRTPSPWWEVFLMESRLYRLLPRKLSALLFLGIFWDHSQTRLAERLSGAALLVRREMIDHIGPLDERFSLFGEDVEWCYRARRHGWRLLFVAEAVVRHECGHAAKQRWPDRSLVAQQPIRGMLQFQQLALSRHYRATNACAALAGLKLHRLMSKASRTITERNRLRWSLATEMYRAELRDSLRFMPRKQKAGDAGLGGSE
jgi:hypothetical protein